MKRLIAVWMVLALALSLGACAKNAEETQETEEELVTFAPAEDSMVMVTGDPDFADQLGMTVDTERIPVPGMGRFIIDKEIAYFCFGDQEGSGEPADVLLRATKNKALQSSLSGLTGTETAPETLELGGVPVIHKDVESGDQVFHQYDFEKDGIVYCLVIRGDLSQERLGVLIASFLEAVRPA